MEAFEAGEILMRLKGHWPSIAREDGVADDWLRLIGRARPDVARRAVVSLIDGWTENRAPHPGDWQQACRTVAYWDNLSTARAIEAPEPDETARERVARTISEAREAIKAGAARREELANYIRACGR